MIALVSAMHLIVSIQYFNPFTADCLKSSVCHNISVWRGPDFCSKGVNMHYYDSYCNMTSSVTGAVQLPATSAS